MESTHAHLLWVWASSGREALAYVYMAYSKLEDDWSKAIELTESKDSVEQKPRIGFEDLEDVEADTAANNGGGNIQLLEKTDHDPEIPLTNEQVSVTVLFVVYF